MAELLKFNQNYSIFSQGNTYLLEDQFASLMYNLGVAEIISEPVTIENASIAVDMSGTNTILTGGTQTTMLVNNSGGILLPSGTPSKLVTSFTRPNDNNNYTINDCVNTSTSTPTVITFSGSSISIGGGGYINDFIVETDATQFANSTLRFWLFDTIPTMVGDNVPFIIDFNNKNIRLGCGYFDVIMGSLLAGSNSIIGTSQPFCEFNSISSTNIYMVCQILSTITAPKANGSFNLTMNVLKLS